MRKICFVTGSRADYSPLYPLMKLASGSKKIKFQLIATCMHLSHKFGNTYKEIENDGFKIDIKVRVPLNSDKPEKITEATGKAMIGIAKAYKKLKPDIVVILGDRFEILSAAFAALSAKIPIAHIHGGEKTIGAIDESIRHAVTKMSAFHFVSTDKYKKRVIQLGENQSKIFSVGALSIETIKKMKFISKKDIEKKLDFKFDKKNFIITHHPVTLDKGPQYKEIDAILSALKKQRNTKKIFTMANADSGNYLINQKIKKFCKNSNNNAVFFKSLGQRMYFSVVKNTNLVLGNSSSGIIEVPSLKIPCIDIGDRQGGRIRNKGIITCLPNERAISIAIKRGLSKNFIKNLSFNKNPNEKKGTSKNILNILIKSNLKNILKKKFCDL